VRASLSSVSTGTISCWNLPAAWAAAALRCECAANSSCSWRDTPNCAATFSDAAMPAAQCCTSSGADVDGTPVQDYADRQKDWWQQHMAGAVVLRTQAAVLRAAHPWAAGSPARPGCQPAAGSAAPASSWLAAAVCRAKGQVMRAPTSMSSRQLCPVGNAGAMAPSAAPLQLAMGLALMDSTPPAMPTVMRPVRMAAATCATACRPAGGPWQAAQ